MNVILSADQYKFSHPPLYPPETAFAQSYFEARSPGESVFFGLQYYLKRFLAERITKEHVNEAEALVTEGGMPFYRAPWDEIVNKYDGALPLRIRAVPEGAVIPNSNVLFTVENTVAGYHWLPSFVETLLEKVWYPTSVATTVRGFNRHFKKAWEISSDAPEESIYFKLTDFGLRGVSSEESGGIGGMALFAAGQNFSDNTTAAQYCERYYSYTPTNISIPAMEHSTVTSWGREGEFDAYKNMMDTYLKPEAYVAMVLDSYDLVAAIRGIAERFRGQIRDSGGVLIHRPDSGTPTKIVHSVLSLLAQEYGCELNTKGFKVLPPCIRVIQGDGISLDTIEDILASIIAAGFSLDNVLFGSGGGLLQRHTRDDGGFAYKTCQIVFANGGRRDVRKQPKTDSGKASKAGNLDLIFLNGEYRTINRTLAAYRDTPSVMQTVYENGELLVDEALEDVRERSRV